MNILKKVLWLLLAGAMVLGVAGCSDDDDDDDDNNTSNWIKVAEGDSDAYRLLATGDSVGSTWQFLQNEVSGDATDCSGAEGTIMAVDSDSGTYTVKITKVYAHGASKYGVGAARAVSNGVEKTAFKVKIAGGKIATNDSGVDYLDDLKKMVSAAYFTTLALYATPSTITKTTDGGTIVLKYTAAAGARTDSAPLFGENGAVADEAAKTSAIEVAAKDDLALFITNQTNNKNEKCTCGKVTYSIATDTSGARDATPSVEFASYGEGFDTVTSGVVDMSSFKLRALVKATVSSAATIKVEYEDGKTLSQKSESNADIKTGLKASASIDVTIAEEEEEE